MEEKVEENWNINVNSDQILNVFHKFGSLMWKVCKTLKLCEYYKGLRIELTK